MTGRSSPESQRKNSASAAGVRRNSVKDAVGSLIRSAREFQRLSQEEAAALTDDLPIKVSRATISDIERGRSLPSIEALVSLSRVLHLEPAEILERVDLAVALPVDLTGLSREELFERAKQHFWDGDFRAAAATYDAILEHVALDPPADDGERRDLLARVEVDRAVALRRSGALKAAQASAERAVDLASGSPLRKAQAYMVLAALLSQRGRSALASDAAGRAEEFARSDPKTHGEACLQRGSVLYRAQDYEAARQAYIKARGLFAKAKDDHHAAHVEGNIGTCWVGMGRLKQARQQLVKAVQLARKTGVPAIEASWLAALAHLSLDEGQLEEAERYATAALRIARPREHTLTIFRAEWTRHLIVKERNPNAADRQRLATLKRLYLQLRHNEGLSEIRDFRVRVLGQEAEIGVQKR